MHCHLFKRLDALKSKRDEYRPLDAHIVKNLHENMMLQWTYHRNAILFVEELTSKQQPLKEH